MHSRYPLATLVAATLAIVSLSNPVQASSPPSSTELVSVTAAGNPTASPTKDVSTSSDGRFVVFRSRNSDLTAAAPDGFWHVYIRDTQSGSILMVDNLGGNPGFGNALDPSVSDDGRFVAFSTEANNLGLPIVSGTDQIVVWNRERGTFALASTGPAGAGNRDSRDADISGDGSVVAFTSSATNLSADDTHGQIQVFTHDMQTGVNQVASVDAAGKSSMLGANAPALADEGRSVGFISISQLTGVPTGGVPQAYVRDMSTGTTMVASSSSESVPADGAVDSLVISADGNTVAFSSAATNLADRGTLPPATRVYSKRLSTSELRLVSVDASGTAVTGDLPSVSRDGESVSFSSSESAIDPEVKDTRASWQVYVSNSRWNSSVMATVDGHGTAGSEYASASTEYARQSWVSADGLHVAFISGAQNIDPRVTPRDPDQIYVRNLIDPARVDRWDGVDRYDVSANAASYGFSRDVRGTVVVSSGETFADALSASAAAGKTKAPLILARRDALPDSAAAELRRISPNRVLIVGGAGTLSSETETAVRSVVPAANVLRLAGSDRFATSAAISSVVFLGGSNTAYVASGENFPDALSASAAAGHLGAPVLLVSRDSLPGVVEAELRRLGVSRIIVAGGPASVSDAVIASLSSIATVSRVSGADRYAGAAAVSRSMFPENTRTVFVASGEVFPDALSGSSGAIARDAPLLLVSRESVSVATSEELRRLNPNRIIVLGGRNTISDGVVAQLQGYLRAG